MKSILVIVLVVMVGIELVDAVGEKCKVPENPCGDEECCRRSKKDRGTCTPLGHPSLLQNGVFCL